MTDAINEACSQQSQSMSQSLNDENELESINDSLTQDAVTACRNLHAEIAKLTDIIQNQQQKIDGLENKLVEILSILKTTTRHSNEQNIKLTERSLVTSTPSAGAKQPKQRTAANVVHGGSG